MGFEYPVKSYINTVNKNDKDEGSFSSEWAKMDSGISQSCVFFAELQGAEYKHRLFNYGGQQRLCDAYRACLIAPF